MSRQKETNFFLRPDYIEALEEYRENFDGSVELRGEASPRYSAYPFVEGVPERIHSLVPAAKLIYLVRDPVDRAIAHYFERLASNRAPRSLDEAFTDLRDPRNLFVCASKYALQASRYMQFFPQDDLLVIENGELRSNRRKTLQSIFAFLGANPDFWTPVFEEELNTIAAKRRPHRMQQVLKRSRAADMARRTLPPRLRQRAFGTARHALSSKFEREAGTPQLRARLADVLREDAERFRELTGMPFAHWST